LGDPVFENFDEFIKDTPGTWSEVRKLIEEDADAGVSYNPGRAPELEKICKISKAHGRIHRGERVDEDVYVVFYDPIQLKWVEISKAQMNSQMN
jgi:hypothetical protein